MRFVQPLLRSNRSDSSAKRTNENICRMNHPATKPKKQKFSHFTIFFFFDLRSSMSNFETLQQIESAVLTSVSADVSRRQQAFEYLEQIKSNPTQSIEIGFEFFRSTRTVDPLVKHFALQCIEETIKYKWTSLEPTLKISIKERLWSLMTETQPLPTHLKTYVTFVHRNQRQRNSFFRF